MKAVLIATVDISLTAREWELYSRMEGSELVAEYLSNAATEAINSAHKVYVETKDESQAIASAWKIWSSVSGKYSKFGAADTEPRYHFDWLMNRLFYIPIGIGY